MTDDIFISTNNDNSLDVNSAAILDNKDSVYKRGLLLRIIAISATLTGLFALLNVLGLHDMGILQRNFNFFFSLSNFIVILLLVKNRIKFLPACCLFLLLCYLGSISAVINVVADEFRAIWFFLTIFFAFMLTGVFIGFALMMSSVIALVSIQLFVTETYSELSFISILIALSFFSMSLNSFTKQMEKYRLQIRKQSRELYYLANKDPLTDVLNSQAHYLRGQSLIKKAKNEQGQLSMLCIVIDNLDLISKKYGSKIEVSLLAYVERLIDTKIYNKGDIAKVSQQEFCILLPNLDILDAKSLAQQINKSVQQNLFSAGQEKIALTLSIGISTLLESDNEIRSIQVRADKALNKAKALGGNNIFTYSV
jgi:diguanylate cyclase (GGDEF)-like protein